MDTGAWWAAVHGGRKESGTTGRLTLNLLTVGDTVYFLVKETIFSPRWNRTCNKIKGLLKNRFVSGSLDA